MVVKKAWMAMATLLAFAALPACATSNVEPTATSSGAGGEGGGTGGSTSSSSGTGGKAIACGDGDIATSEVCDDGNIVDGDGCSAKCELEMGWDCSGTKLTVCITKCGDGLLVGKEACDDGNTAKADGCSDTCTVDNGYACTGAPSVCATVCGDGILAGKEECDNHNATAGDGCSDLCKVEKGWTCIGQPSTCTTNCGDGILAGAEVCDDHNFAAADGCDAACLVEPNWTCTGAPSVCVTVCGDGNILGAEVCDDGNTAGGDGCGLNCIPEPGYTCTGMPSKCGPTCGDGVMVTGPEGCDDGNTANGDGCNIVCKVEPGFICSGTMPTKCATVCGDSYAAGTETCDTGPFKPNDGCDDTCHAEHGYVCNNFPSVCTTVCGDGVVGGTEACDNGGVGPGCTPSCTVIPGYKCQGEPSVCITICGDGILAGNETCDDGNLVNGDCCSNACGSETGCEIEANDAIPIANDFNALAMSAIVKGTIQPVGDLDYYVITIPAGQTAVLNIATTDGFNSSCVNNTEDSFLTVYDVNNVALGSDDNSGAGNCAQLQVVGLTAGDYFVEVKSGSNSVFSYALTIQVQVVVCGNGTKEPGEQCDDGNIANGDGCSSTCLFEFVTEIEPNNTPAQALANPLFPANQLWKGAITPLGDNDYYRIHLNATSDLRIQTFDGNGPGNCVSTDTVIYLYASNGTTQLASNDEGGITPCSLIDSNVTPTFAGARHLAAGDYYVRVQRYNNSLVIPAYEVIVTYNAVCGNGLVEGSEQCDGGLNCGPTCNVLGPLCGDGFISPGEVCDDGNTTSGDGCSATCQQIEAGYTCTTGVVPTVCKTILNCPAPGQVMIFTGAGLPAAINDLSTTSNSITVAAAGNVVQAVFQVNISHTYDADIDMTLQSPTSGAIDISSDNGGSGDNYSDTVFSDNCPVAVTSGIAPFTGCYKPEASMTSFNGQPAAGVWKLAVADDASSDTGTLNSWTLSLCVQ